MRGFLIARQFETQHQNNKTVTIFRIPIRVEGGGGAPQGGSRESSRPSSQELPQQTAPPAAAAANSAAPEENEDPIMTKIRKLHSDADDLGKLSFICLSLCLSICLSILSFYLAMYLIFLLSIFINIYLSVLLCIFNLPSFFSSISQSIHLTFFLPNYLSISFYLAIFISF